MKYIVLIAGLLFFSSFLNSTETVAGPQDNCQWQWQYNMDNGNIEWVWVCS